MSRNTHIVLFALAPLVLAPVSYAAPGSLEPIYDLSCDQVESRWISQADTIVEVSDNIQLLGSLLDDQACEEVNPDFEKTALRILVDQLVNVAPDLNKKTNQKAALGTKQLADTAMAYFSDWRLHELVGDHARLQGDLLGAKEQYGAALSSYESEQFVYPAPSAARVMKIHSKLVEVTNVWVQTGASLNDIRKTRAGGPSDGISLNWRAWTTQKSLIPLKFEYDSVDFSREGKEIARGVIVDLETQKVRKLLIVGHTDPKGSDQYNLKLSKARAEAVRDFLLAEGFQGEVTLDWKGERDPFKFDNIGLYTEEQQHAAHRRVVFEVLEKAN
nr:OmpA family protein [uncultured Roseibium sp.]